MRESDEAERELEKVDLKLQGINQMRSPTPQSVDGQVARLINDATDINNLCQMCAPHPARRPTRAVRRTAK